jgi:hypothetical protein
LTKRGPASSLPVLFLILLAGAVTGCGTMANGRGWGQDATLAPGWARVGQAVLNAAAAPETWGPAAGALAFQVNDADHKVTEWAARKTPVFGSQERADRMSNDLRDAAGAIWIASAVATPSGDSAYDWSIAKAKGLGVQEGAGIFMRGTVGILKDGTDRTRPNGIDTGSFPSAHATGAALYATLASRNLDALQWSPAATTASQLGLGALTAATAWARLEANQHYPSDVLGGIALGHFLGAFFTEAFVGLDNPRKAMMVVEPSREGAVAMLRFNY